MYGPSICTRFVQMDTRRSHVCWVSPTSGSITLWFAEGALAGQMRVLLSAMHGVLYLQPLAVHELQYVPWEVLDFSPIGHPPRAGATTGRWPTVPGVSRLLAPTQMGPIQSPEGPPNPSGEVPCQRPACSVRSTNAPVVLASPGPPPPPLWHSLT